MRFTSMAQLIKNSERNDKIACLNIVGFLTSKQEDTPHSEDLTNCLLALLFYRQIAHSMYVEVSLI